MIPEIKLKDFVRIAHNYQWRGQEQSQTADVIDYGLIVTGIIENPHNLENPSYKLLSTIPFLIQITINKVWLDKILVAHYPFRTFEAVDFMRSSADIIWKVKSDRDDVVLLVYNPRMEPDVEDDGSTRWGVEWDKITKEDGTELTDEEHDNFCDDLRVSLRALLTVE